MKPHASMPRSAFSLIELSVVIVIIGLLVGGVVSLSSYTRNSTLSATIGESKYYINAFTQFQTRYNAAPGDYNTASSAWTGAGNGDGNTVIRATGSAPGNRDEWFYTFQHLALAGFIQGKFTGATSGGGGTYVAKTGTNVPAASAERTAFLFDHPDALDGVVSSDAFYFDGIYPNVLRIAGLNDNATSIPDQPFVTGKQALQLDDKFDDGLPGQGSIVTPISTALSGCATTAVASTAVYDVSTDNKTCYFIVRMQ
jgi:prepilin-type N-terminal cleavage/methylation domain-containing protein